MNDYSSIIHKSQKLEIIKMYGYVRPYNETIFSNKKEWNINLKNMLSERRQKQKTAYY